MVEVVSSEKVKQVRLGLTDFTDNVARKWSTDEVILECMAMRKYSSKEMFNTLKEIGLFKCDYLTDLTYFSPTTTEEEMRDWGILTQSGDFLLKGRYVVPIRDIAGNVTAWVGWFPDNRKYITTPTVGFSKDGQFFNIECYKKCIEENKGTVYLVEGIFDTLSLRSLGFSALGCMGLTLSVFKTQMLRRFGKVIAIPDNDKAGKSVNPYTCSLYPGSKNAPWDILNDSVFVQLPNGVKDVDDFVKEFDCVEDLKSCETAKGLKKLSEE